MIIMSQFLIALPEENRSSYYFFRELILLELGFTNQKSNKPSKLNKVPLIL